MPSQTPHGLEYPLMEDNAALTASDPPTNRQGWFEKGWRKLDASAGHFVIPGTPEETWISRNATFSGLVWNREDTTRGASAIVLPSAGGLAFKYSGAGSNPISWSSRDILDTSGFVIGAAIQDASITGAKIANKSITKDKISFPARLTSTLSSDVNVPQNPTWLHILQVNAPSAGRVLVVVQQAVRLTSSGTHTFNGSLYVGGSAVDPMVILRTSTVNYTGSHPLIHTLELGGAVSISYAVSASTANVFQVVAQGTFMSVVYLPES